MKKVLKNAKIHKLYMIKLYRSDGKYDSTYQSTKCGNYGYSWNCTFRWNKVTCKKCLKRKQ